MVITAFVNWWKYCKGFIQDYVEIHCHRIYLCGMFIILKIFNTHSVFQGRTVSSSRKVPRSPTRSQPSHRDIRQNIARLKNVDSKLANRILDEILDSGPKVKFTDIGKWLYLIDTCVFIKLDAIKLVEHVIRMRSEHCWIDDVVQVHLECHLIYSGVPTLMYVWIHVTLSLITCKDGCDLQGQSLMSLLPNASLPSHIIKISS